MKTKLQLIQDQIDSIIEIEYIDNIAYFSESSENKLIVKGIPLLNTEKLRKAKNIFLANLLNKIKNKNVNIEGQDLSCIERLRCFSMHIDQGDQYLPVYTSQLTVIKDLIQNEFIEPLNTVYFKMLKDDLPILKKSIICMIIDEIEKEV